MEIVQGKRSGSRKFLHAGYAYHLDTTSVRHGTYRCASRSTTQCRGTVRIGANEEVVSLELHNHAPNRHIAEEARMKEEILRLCRETLRSFDDIFRDISLRYEEPVVIAVSLRSVRSAMKRERTRCRPPLPHNIARLREILPIYRLRHDMIRRVVRGNDGMIALLFANEQVMLNRLTGVRELYVSCIFETNAVGTRPFRVLSMYVRSMGSVALPIFYISMEKSSEALYTALWRMIFALAPGFEDSLATVITDYERHMVVAIRQEMPNVQIETCWFFYRQALLRR